MLNYNNQNNTLNDFEENSNSNSQLSSPNPSEENDLLSSDPSSKLKISFSNFKQPNQLPMKRKTTRRFGIRRPKSRKQKEEMSKLREISMRLGGAQYFKKKSTESVPCEVSFFS